MLIVSGPLNQVQKQLTSFECLVHVFRMTFLWSTQFSDQNFLTCTYKTLVALNNNLPELHLVDRNENFLIMFYKKFVHDATCLLTRFHVMDGADIVSSLQDPKYKIDYHPAESPVLPVRSLAIALFLKSTVHLLMGQLHCTCKLSGELRLVSWDDEDKCAL